MTLRRPTLVGKFMTSRRHFFTTLVWSGVLVGLGFVLGTWFDRLASSDFWQQEPKAAMSAETIPQAELSLLTRALATLEVRVIRLEALGLDLIQRYGLDEAAFDLLETPGMGGMLNPVVTNSGLELSETLTRLDELDRKLQSRELHLGVLKGILDDMNRDAMRLAPSWPAEKGWISSLYGNRVSPFSGRREFHAGVDIVARYGSGVRAFSGGIVKQAIVNGHYGKMIEIDHGNDFTTRYAHNSINLVTEGTVVSKGDVVALVGSSGRSTGPHLHFEIRRHGRSLDPAPYLSRTRSVPFARR